MKGMLSHFSYACPAIVARANKVVIIICFIKC